ncbi:MAG: adenosylmethionine decarboxylase [Burkholderiaceae bacterium]|nr:adenosylmethionine decarboxylase [Burkholderiaceae bacterium]
MRGLHLTADLFDCADPAGLLSDGARLQQLCEHLTDEAGLTVVGSHFHAFPPGPHGTVGWTGVLLLAESHLAVHTWPEQHAVTLDVFVCNVGQDNSARARRLLDALVARFAPGRAHRQQVERGVTA